MSRLPYILLKSAQWESNPHFRHGKAAGYRYIMGARSKIELSKSIFRTSFREVRRQRFPGTIKSTGWDSNPRHRVTKAVSWPLDDQCKSGFQVGPGGFEPPPVGLRDPDATVTPWTRIGFNFSLAWQELNLRPGAYKTPALTR